MVFVYTCFTSVPLGKKGWNIGWTLFWLLAHSWFFLSTSGAIIIFEIIMFFLEGIGNQKRNSCISQYRVNVVVVSPPWKQYCKFFMGGLGCIHSRWTAFLCVVHSLLYSRIVLIVFWHGFVDYNYLSLNHQLIPITITTKVAYE